MRIHLLAVGTRMPAWVDAGFEEYARRMPRECQLLLTEISAGARARKDSAERRMSSEARALLERIPERAAVVALDERGRAWRSRDLAGQLSRWLDGGTDVALLVGGADGLHPSARARAAQIWSLSPLTLPHGLVRIVVAEQLYRAWTILGAHPYHRE